MTKQLEQSGQKFGQSYALPVLEASIDFILTHASAKPRHPIPRRMIHKNSCCSSGCMAQHPIFTF